MFEKEILKTTAEIKKHVGDVFVKMYSHKQRDIFKGLSFIVQEERGFIIAPVEWTVAFRLTGLRGEDQYMNVKFTHPVHKIDDVEPAVESIVAWASLIKVADEDNMLEGSEDEAFEGTL